MSALDLVAPFTVRHLISTTFICKLAVNLQVFDSDSSAPLHNFLATFPASAGALTKPLLIVGDLKSFHVRVDIDENDAWRFKDGAKAEASLRGNKDFRTDLTFVRVEPYVVPKRSLTGSSVERVDTRVLQVIYSFNRGNIPAFVGQQMDVFIESEK